ncbi:hypothetical protein, partial [Streptomyces sp. 8N616]|uniref:hypothetical protein n=1 Tax=Streptomyces sp. 8N616 TaxID=3457414 RepID=UPI003FCFF295
MYPSVRADAARGPTSTAGRARTRPWNDQPGCPAGQPRSGRTALHAAGVGPVAARTAGTGPRARRLGPLPPNPAFGAGQFP